MYNDNNMFFFNIIFNTINLKSMRLLYTILSMCDVFTIHKFKISKIIIKNTHLSNIICHQAKKKKEAPKTKK